MIVPWILPDKNEKLALAKAFCIIAMTIRPGAMKSAKGTPSTLRSPRPRATSKITKNRTVLTAGPQIVCVWTLRNRRTSLI